jgi:hypothetical protein
MMLRKVLVALIALALLAACGGAPEPVAGPTPTPTPAPAATVEPTPTPTPTPTPAAGPVQAPLTGLLIEGDEAAELAERPVLAVKIDNNRAALPQDGIEHADIVVNELVEFGFTRFIALFHSTDPGEVGPVRSGREVDAELMPAFQPVFAYSGAADEVVDILERSGLLLVTEGDGGFERRSRPGYPREHTLYLTAEDQWEAGARLPAAEEPWPFDEAVAPGGNDVDGVSLVFSRETTITYEWDGERFLREQYGAPHVTESGEQISAANVVVPRVDIATGPRGGGTVAIDVIGEGEATVFRDGRAFEARWRKDSVDAQFEWLTPDGEPLPLAPGQTWVELVPVTGSVEVRVVEDDG